MDNLETDLPEIVQELIDLFAKYTKTKQGEQQIQNYRIFTHGYVDLDSGDADVIVIGNFNNISRWNNKLNQSEVIDNIPGLLGDALSTLGVVLEWEDEYSPCIKCSRLIRINPDSYCWLPQYTIIDGVGPVCPDCIEKDAESYLRSLEGQSEKSFCLDNILPEDYGYIQLEDEFERGFHPGQDDDPRIIADSLEKLGIYRYFFEVTSTGQFDTRFSVYIHEKDFSKLNQKDWTAAKKTSSPGKSPSEQLKRALQKPLPPRQEGTIQVVTHDLKNDKTKVKKLTPQEFIDGESDANFPSLS